MKSKMHMKTLLRLLGVGVLTTFTITLTIACCQGKTNTPVTTMNAKVAADFGFVNNNGVSTIETKVTVTANTASWTSPQLSNITAAKLLTSGNEPTPKAVSVDAGDFLVNVFKLPVIVGTGADRTFTRSEAELITMTVKTWLPTIAKIGTTDYAINGGTAVIQFKKGTEQLGIDYTLNILAKPTVGIIQSLLPRANEITLANFNLPNFSNGQPRAPFRIGTDLTNFLKNTNAPIVKIKSIVNLINQGLLEVEITEENIQSFTNLSTGDDVKVIILIGNIYFTTEYTLTVT